MGCLGYPFFVEQGEFVLFSNYFLDVILCFLF